MKEKNDPWLCAKNLKRFGQVFCCSVYWVGNEELIGKLVWTPSLGSSNAKYDLAERLMPERVFSVQPRSPAGALAASSSPGMLGCSPGAWSSQGTQASKRSGKWRSGGRGGSDRPECELSVPGSGGGCMHRALPAVILLCLRTSSGSKPRALLFTGRCPAQDSEHRLWSRGMGSGWGS